MPTRFMAPSDCGVAKLGTYASGASYEAPAGGVVDINDNDAVAASSDGWILVGGSGPTSNRATWLAGPAASAWQNLGRRALVGFGQTPPPPLWYYDTTLGKLIFYDGSAWRDPATGSTV